MFTFFYFYSTQSLSQSLTKLIVQLIGVISIKKKYGLLQLNQKGQSKICSPIENKKLNKLSLSFNQISIRFHPTMINQQQKLTASKIHTFSPEFLHYKTNLLQTLKQYHKQTLIQEIYLTQRCYRLLIHERITQVELFGCGFKKIYNRKNISPYIKLEKIIFVSNIDEQSIKELNQVQYIFPQIYLMTLQTTNSQHAQVLKSSQVRKSLRSIKQINLNFFTFLDGAHYVQKMEKSTLFKSSEEQQQPYRYEGPSKCQKISSYKSYLLSYPKFYEYEIYYLKSFHEDYNQFVSDLEKELTESLSIISTHQNDCKNFDRISSPRIKCLVLNRQTINDLISPLIYGYFYGPLCEEFIDQQKLIEGAEKLSSKGKMFNDLFDKDFDQAAEYIQKLAKDKTALEGPFETNYFYKAKHVIVSYEDPSPIQLSLHISCWKQTRHCGQLRIGPAALQQDIANRNDQYDRKVSNGNCVSKIKEWILETPEDQVSRVTEDELIKLGMITQITGDLWFFHHNSIKNLVNDDNNKIKYENFLKRRKSQIPTHRLTEKLQSLEQSRSQLYRHEPKLIPICQKWLRSVLGLEQNEGQQKYVGSNGVKFQKKSINNDIIRNRDSRLVIIVDGIVGYNELAMLKRMIQQTTDKQVSILVQSFCSNQQYADYLMRPIKKINVLKIKK